MNSSHVFSLKPIRSDLLLSIATLQRHLRGEASKRTALQAFSGLPQSPKPAKKQTESFSPAICFKVGSQVRDSSCHLFSLYLASLLSSTHYCTSRLLFLCLCYPSSLSSSTLHPVFTFAVGSNRGA